MNNKTSYLFANNQLAGQAAINAPTALQTGWARYSGDVIGYPTFGTSRVLEANYIYWVRVKTGSAALTVGTIWIYTYTVFGATGAGRFKAAIYTYDSPSAGTLVAKFYDGRTQLCHKSRLEYSQSFQPGCTSVRDELLGGLVGKSRALCTRQHAWQHCRRLYIRSLWQLAKLNHRSQTVDFRCARHLPGHRSDLGHLAENGHHI